MCVEFNLQTELMWTVTETKSQKVHKSIYERRGCYCTEKIDYVLTQTIN